MRWYGLSWSPLLGMAGLVVGALALGLALLLQTVQSDQRARQSGQLLVQARLIQPLILPAWQAGESVQLPAALAANNSGDRRVAILSPEGDLIAAVSSVANPAELGIDDAIRERALRDGVATAVRRAPPEGRDRVVVAVRIGGDRATLALLGLSEPAYGVWGALARRPQILALVGGLALLALLTVFGILGRQWRGMLRRIAQTAESFSADEVGATGADGTDEWSRVSRALNQVRARLLAHADTIDRQRHTLESLLNQLHEGVIVVRGDGRIALINPAAIRLMNLGVGRIGEERLFVGKIIERVIPHHDLHRLVTGQRERFIVPSDLEAQRPRGERSDGQEYDEARLQVEAGAGVRHLLARASGIALLAESAPESAGAGRLVVLTDITDLTRTIQIKTDFVANASHELRTPLSTIRAAVETLLHMDLPREGASAAHFLQVVHRQSARLEALVSDLLDLAKLEAPGTRFEPQSLRWSEFIADLQARFAPALQERQHVWKHDAQPGTDAPIYAHPHLLRLVLDNLVDNAIKYTPSGGRITLSLERLPGRIDISVADTGVGIPSEDQQRVFERFHQVERARSGPQRGTGLGLAIVRHAVAAMEGAITLTSELGRGTRVTVRLPQPVEASDASASRKLSA